MKYRATVKYRENSIEPLQSLFSLARVFRKL
jgi:hypothetical protein